MGHRDLFLYIPIVLVDINPQEQEPSIYLLQKSILI